MGGFTTNYYIVTVGAPHGRHERRRGPLRTRVEAGDRLWAALRGGTMTHDDHRSVVRCTVLQLLECYDTTGGLRAVVVEGTRGRRQFRFFPPTVHSKNVTSHYTYRKFAVHSKRVRSVVTFASRDMGSSVPSRARAPYDGYSSLLREAILMRHTAISNHSIAGKSRCAPQKGERAAAGRLEVVARPSPNRSVVAPPPPVAAHHSRARRGMRGTERRRPMPPIGPGSSEGRPHVI